MVERSEEDVVAGILRIPVGGTVKPVPTLKAKYIEGWAELLGSAGGSAKVPSEWTMADVAGMSSVAADRLLDLVVAYDRTSALGGREWLAENADPAQLHAAVVQMVGNAYPLANDPTALVALMVMQAVVPSGRENSPSGASTNGGDHPTRSGRSSTRSR